MALTCNIDARGKKARLINGIILVLAAIPLAVFWARPSHSIFAWIITGLVLCGGGFAIFEARAGWCVLRAMGIKTKI